MFGRSKWKATEEGSERFDLYPLDWIEHQLMMIRTDYVDQPQFTGMYADPDGGRRVLSQAICIDGLGIRYLQFQDAPYLGSVETPQIDGDLADSVVELLPDRVTVRFTRVFDGKRHPQSQFTCASPERAEQFFAIARRYTEEGHQIRDDFLRREGYPEADD